MRRWARWEEVLLDEPLSQSNTAQMLEHSLLLFIYIYIFFMSSVAMLLDNRSGLLSMPDWAHIPKLCKDIGKEVDTVFDPNTQRFSTSLEVGHTWKHFQTAAAPPALSWVHLLRRMASRQKVWQERGSCRDVGKQSQSVLCSSLEMLLKDGKYAATNTLEWNYLI